MISINHYNKSIDESGAKNLAAKLLRRASPSNDTMKKHWTDHTSKNFRNTTQIT